MGDHGEMDAMSLVFDVGDRVVGWGRLVADADGEWLDLARTITLEYRPGPRPRSDRSVRLIGANFSTVPTEFGPNNAIPGSATITGVWVGDAIRVEQQSPEGPAPESSPSWFVPPCPAPPRGWLHGMNGRSEENLDFELGDLMATGAAVTAVTYRPSPTQAVLVIAASDCDAVEAFLGPQLPGRLCVIESRWTRAQLDEVVSHLLDRWKELAIDSVGETVDEAAQPSIEVHLVRVTAELAGWTSTLPDELLTVRPLLSPV